jgi:hypothetical protein
MMKKALNREEGYKKEGADKVNEESGKAAEKDIKTKVKDEFMKEKLLGIFG